MVAGANDQLYSPFPRGRMAEDGPTSSEQGSDLHSPVYDQPFPHLLPDGTFANQAQAPLSICALTTASIKPDIAQLIPSPFPILLRLSPRPSTPRMPFRTPNQAIPTSCHPYAIRTVTSRSTVPTILSNPLLHRPSLSVPSPLGSLLWRIPLLTLRSPPLTDTFHK